MLLFGHLRTRGRGAFGGAGGRSTCPLFFVDA